MVRQRPPPSSSLFQFLVFFRHLTTFPSYSAYKTAVSISHSLLTRVSTLRAARGDLCGAARAKAIAEKLDRGLKLGIWRIAWSIGWTGIDYRELLGSVSDLKELMSLLAGLGSARSEAEKVDWIARDYSSLAKAAKSALARLLNTFNQKGPLKEVVETVQKEVVEGGLLRDCVEVGSNDLRRLIGILKDCASQFSSGSGYSGHSKL